MNPYFTPPYMNQPQAQPIQPLPPHVDPRVVSYFVESAEQLSTITPMPNTIYLGINFRDGKIFMRRMNNDGLMDVQTFSVAAEQTKRTDTQEILERIAKIEKKIGETNEPHVIDVTE